MHTSQKENKMRTMHKNIELITIIPYPASQSMVKRVHKQNSRQNVQKEYTKPMNKLDIYRHHNHVITFQVIKFNKTK